MGDFLQELLQSHLAALNESEALSKKQENDLSIKKMELEYHATRTIQESEQFWAKAQVLASVLVKTEEAPERKEQQHDDSRDRVTLRMCLNEMANNIHSCQAKALDFLQEENRSASLRQSVSAIKEQIEKEEQITREYLKTLQENEIERLRNEQQQQQQAEMEARRQREAELLNGR
jgi:hypothetical protein